MEQVNKIYLGDSVYAQVDEFKNVIITTENGFGPRNASNRIIMDPQVLEMLVLFSRKKGVLKL